MHNTRPPTEAVRAKYYDIIKQFLTLLLHFIKVCSRRLINLLVHFTMRSLLVIEVFCLGDSPLPGRIRLKT